MSFGTDHDFVEKAIDGPYKPGNVLWAEVTPFQVRAVTWPDAVPLEGEFTLTETPEPTTIAFFAGGLAVLLAMRARGRKRPRKKPGECIR